MLNTNLNLLGTILITIIVGILLFSFLNDIAHSDNERYWLQGLSIAMMSIGGLGLFMMMWDKTNSQDAVIAQEDVNKLT